MSSSDLRKIYESYQNIYKKDTEEVISEAECECEEEESNEKETPKMNGKKKGKKENEKEDEKEVEKEEVETDFFDYLLEYLVSEGYADTNKAALAIMANMSEEWKRSIVEGEEGKEEPQKPFTGEGPKKPKGWKPTGPKLKTGQRPGYAR